MKDSAYLLALPRSRSHLAMALALRMDLCAWSANITAESTAGRLAPGGQGDVAGALR
jgi:hypothetical protein